MSAPVSATLKRCKRCLLPETHETLVLDAEGICNVVGLKKLRLKLIGLSD